MSAPGIEDCADNMCGSQTCWENGCQDARGAHLPAPVPTTLAELLAAYRVLYADAAALGIDLDAELRAATLGTPPRPRYVDPAILWRT